MKIANPPCHIGIILDGNGRWAKKHHSPRLVGHKAGANAVKKMLIAANKIGIKVVSVYAFSTENWKRSKEEVNGIFDIIEKTLDENFDRFVRNNYKFLVMGDISKLNTNLQTKLEKLTDATKNNTGLIFNVAINYGGRAEIVRAANRLIESGKTNISEQDF
ncbi:MAG: di-trans,poly-cis-decaprenylcistransferase, partial [Eubacteriales bacterium]|nr:di-trans,poly-cis-decaprenylcistransferase [Eubacteriales bacterium]